MSLILFIVVVIILLILFKCRREAIANEKNAARQQKVFDATVIASKSLGDLLSLLDLVLNEFKLHLTEGIEAMAVPITPDELKNLVTDQQEKYKILKNKFFKERQAVENVLYKHITLFASFMEEILYGESRVVKYTKKRLKSRQKQIDIIMFFLSEDATPLAFFMQDIGEMIGEYDNCITPIDLFQDVISKKVKDKELRSRAETLVANAKADWERWSELSASIRNVDTESERLEKYLKDPKNEIWLKTFFGSDL